MKEKLVFVTNDDGYNSRGIQALLEVARKFGRVVAIAPETPQSGMSQAITINNPLFLREVSKGDGVEVYAFSGTPVDCVKIAFDYFLKGRKVDLALSGINHGSNSAANILYSGTMGGAIESSFYGCPAIGLSLDDHSLEADFEAAKIYSERIVRAVVEANPPTPFCLNVNIPKGRPEAVKGIRVCRQNKGYWREEFFRRHDPRGREYFWLTGEFVNGEPEATDTDEWALANKYVAGPRADGYDRLCADGSAGADTRIGFIGPEAGAGDWAILFCGGSCPGRNSGFRSEVGIAGVAGMCRGDFRSFRGE